MPSVRKVALLECAGNGRDLPDPQGERVTLGVGGSRERRLGRGSSGRLARPSGGRTGAVEVILEGADSGKIVEEPKTPGDYSLRPKPSSDQNSRGRARIPDERGGVDAQSWLSGPRGRPRLVRDGVGQVARPDHRHPEAVSGYFQTLDYAIFEPAAGLPSLTALTANAVKSQIIRPEAG